MRVNTVPQLVSAAGADLLTLSAGLASSRGAEDKLIAAWMVSSKIQSIPVAPAVAAADGKASGKRRSVPSGQEPPAVEEDARSHLSMLLPMCLDLVLAPCAFPALKEVAVSLIR